MIACIALSLGLAVPLLLILFSGPQTPEDYDGGL